MPILEKMNLNYLLNKEYYEELSHKHFDDCNRALTGRRFAPAGEELSFSRHSFVLKTAYPGLLVGIGNTHEAGEGVKGKDEEGAEIKLGFTLDFVTGLPVIPGSTVKGVLRGAFKYHPDYAAGLLGIHDKNQVKELEKTIFAEGSNKVVFFDAILVGAGKDGRLLGLDNITPHPDPLKSPIPLTLLKVIPNVRFLFSFGFDRWDGANISAEQLRNVFKDILVTLGIGAKTNVGFGALEPLNEKEEAELQAPRRLVHTPAVGASASQSSRAQAPAEKPEGICKYEGCNEHTKPNNKGGYHDYCQKHYLEVQGKHGKKQ
jgi:CRISPR-associated protein Cmr6